MRKGNGAIGIIVTIVIMLIIFSALVFAAIRIGLIKIDMNALSFNKPKQESNSDTQEQVDIYSKDYNVDDYVSVSKDEQSGLKLVEFKNIKSDDLEDFKTAQQTFKEQKLDSGNKRTNTVRTNADKGILSVYTKETIKKSEDIVKEISYAVNVNIQTGNKVTNLELLDLYDLKIDNLTKMIINKFIENSADLTYININTQAKISASDIKTNISKYTETIKENIEKLTLYTRKDKVYCDIDNEKILELLGLKLENSNTAFKEISSISL